MRRFATSLFIAARVTATAAPRAEAGGLWL